MLVKYLRELEKHEAKYNEGLELVVLSISYKENIKLKKYEINV